MFVFRVGYFFYSWCCDSYRHLIPRSSSHWCGEGQDYYILAWNEDRVKWQDELYRTHIPVFSSLKIFCGHQGLLVYCRRHPPRCMGESISLHLHIKSILLFHHSEHYGIPPIWTLLRYKCTWPLLNDKSGWEFKGYCRFTIYDNN